METIQIESPVALRNLLHNAKEAHTVNAPNLPEHAWEDWYAIYMFAVLHGLTAPVAVALANVRIREQNGSHKANG